MDEKKETQSPQEQVKGKEEKETAEVSPPKVSGDKESSIKDSPLAQARALDKSLKEQNAIMSANIQKLEERDAKIMLAGTAEGGSVTPVKKKMTDTEMADAVLKGEVDPLKMDGFI